MVPWREIGAALLDLLAPSLCPACRLAEGPDLCVDCWARVPRLSDPCPRCGTPGVKPDGACRTCVGEGIPHIRRVVVQYPYRGLMKELVGNAKAAGRPSAVRALASLMPPLPAGTSPEAVVVPVPPARGRRPGPHLATALAKALAHRHQLPFRRLLRITRLAAEQHRLTLAERRANVEDLFVCRGDAPNQVVLIDDLLTSGATASSAAAALREAGAKRVVLVCLARTPRRGENEDPTNIADEESIEI